MSSHEMLEKLLKPAPHRGTTVREFVSALANRRTYAPTQNAYALFGFLWGLPIPFFSVGIDLWASGHPFTPALLWQHPVHLFFLLHPILFAIVFGAMGTVRHRKDRQIRQLVVELERHTEKLAAANEKLKGLDRLKAQFMENVTHELKTPLVAIRGYNESILEGRFGPLTVKQVEGLTIAMRNVERLQKLIDELLEFEKIDSGEFKLDVTEFDLVPLIGAVLGNFQPQVEAGKLAVRTESQEALWVRADRDKIGHVLLNLLSNAVKFSPDGGEIVVRARMAEEGDCAVVSIIDHGPGIPSAAQSYLFTRFWQADGSSRRKYGGTGLGLAIVKGILDAHGTTIDVVSAEGSGTIVHFYLPLARKGSSVGAPQEVMS